jgi:hypothetical protein
MMNKKRRTKIQFESFEKTTIRFRRNRGANVFCRECLENTVHFSVAQAAQALKLSETAVFRLAESGTVHSTETAWGALLVCGNSLMVWEQKISFIGGKK